MSFMDNNLQKTVAMFDASKTNGEKKELGSFEFAGRTPCREVISSCTRSRRLFSYLSGSAEFISLAKLETVEDERTVAN